MTEDRSFGVMTVFDFFPPPDFRYNENFTRNQLVKCGFTYNVKTKRKQKKLSLKKRIIQCILWKYRGVLWTTHIKQWIKGRYRLYCLICGASQRKWIRQFKPSVRICRKCKKALKKNSYSLLSIKVYIRELLTFI